MKSTPPKRSSDYTKDLHKIIAEEDKYIERHRDENDTNHLYNVNENGVPSQKWGLCISGGGIRSSTLGLGALQKFMRDDVYKYFDYISTVSGGGFIGSCTSALLSAPRKKDVDNAKYAITGERTNDGPITYTREEKKAREEDIDINSKPGINKNNAPFLTRGKYYRDQSSYSPKHQLNHLLEHGEYLTRNRSVFSLDVKRLLSAVLGGAISNVLLFLLLLLIVVSGLTVLFQILGGNSFWDEIQFKKLPASLFDLYQQIPKSILALSFLIGMGFAAVYHWVGVSYIKENINTFSKHTRITSLWESIKVLFSVKSAKYQHGEKNPISWNEVFNYWSFGIFDFFYNLNRDTEKENLLSLEMVDDNETRNDFLVKRVVRRFALWTLIVSGIYVIVVILYARFLIPSIEYPFYLILFLPIWFSFGMLVYLFFLGMTGESSPNYERITRSTYLGLYGGAFNTVVAAVLVPVVIIGVFFYNLKDNLNIEYSQLTLLFSGSGLTFLLTNKTDGGVLGGIPSMLERFIPGLRKIILNLSIFIILILSLYALTFVITTFDDFDEWVYQTIIAPIKGQFYIPFLGICAMGFSRLFTIQKKLVYNTIFVLLWSVFIFLIVLINESWDNFLVEDIPMFTLIFFIVAALLVGFLLTQRHGTTINIVIGIIANLSLLLLFTIKSTFWVSFLESIEKSEMTPALIFCFGIALTLILGFFIKKYKGTIFTFYKDRLTEAFLITSGPKERQTKRWKQQGSPKEMLRNHENLLLSDLGHDNYRGPYHILVAALNLKSKYIYLRKDQRSEHFIFSKYYIGSKSTGYVKTRKYREGKTTLSEAMTISAAAVNSAMGSIGFFAQTFLITLFNLRLGTWMPNPWAYSGLADNEEEDRRRFNRISYLIDEYTGNFSTRKALVNLSDGGHTGDNLGLLPLLKRRCSTVVVCDFEEDRNFGFESFNNALRMAYIEEGVWIHIDLKPLMPEEKKSTHTKTSVAVGTIYYPDESRGRIIYIKSSLSGELATSVRSYSRKHADFPHQSTSDQYFDSAQYEAYRSLGYDLAEMAIHPIHLRRAVEEQEVLPEKEPRRNYMEAIAAARAQYGRRNKAWLKGFQEEEVDELPPMEE